MNKSDFIITFGAVGVGDTKIKGLDLLMLAIEDFSDSTVNTLNVKIIIFGGVKKKSSMFGIDVIELGHISSELELAKIYSVK